MKISRRCIVYFISAVLFFQPARYAIGNSLTRVWNILLISVSMIYSILFFLEMFKRHRKPNTESLFLLLSFVYCFFGASVFNSNTSNFKSAVIYMIPIIGFMCYISRGLRKDRRTLLKSYIAAGLLMSSIHLYTILKYQNTGGMRTGISSLGRAYSDNWFFLSHANASFFIIFPVIVSLFVYAYNYNRKILKYSYLYLAFTIVCFYIQWSVAGLIGFLIFALFIFLDNLQSARTSKIVMRLINLRFVLIITVIIEAFLALFMGLSRYTDFLYLYFGKGQSIFARLRIWDRAIQYIAQSPLIGNGWNYETEAVYRLTSSHTHNILLEFLYCGGIVGTTLFIVAIFSLQKRISIYQSFLSQDKGFRVLLLSIVPLIAAFTFDFYLYRFHPIIVFLLLINYCSPILVKDFIERKS